MSARGPKRASPAGFSTSDVRSLLIGACLSGLVFVVCANLLQMVLDKRPPASNWSEHHHVAVKLLQAYHHLDRALNGVNATASSAPEASSERRQEIRRARTSLRQHWERFVASAAQSREPPAHPSDTIAALDRAIARLDEGVDALLAGEMTRYASWYITYSAAGDAFDTAVSEARELEIVQHSEYVTTLASVRGQMNWTVGIMMMAMWTVAVTMLFLMLYQRRAVAHKKEALEIAENELSLRRAVVQATIDAEQSRTDSLQARKQFVAAVNHELRTPMQSLSNCASILEMAGGDPAAADVSTVIRLAIEQMEIQIRDLAQFALTQSPAHTFRQAPIVVAAIFKEIQEFNGAQAKASAIDVRFSLSDPDNLTVVADRFRILQVANNLISNAIKYTSEGFVEVRIRADRVAQPAGEQASSPRQVLLRVEVKDSGVGIPPEDLSRVFEPMYRASNSRSGSQPGQGMGLAIAHSLAHEMNGDLSIASALGVGTTVVARMILPEHVEASPSAAPECGATSGR